MRFLVIGAGPAGLYSSRFLHRQFGERACIDLLEREFLPGGLLRWGVAPDHPELRHSISQFDELFKANNFNYFGGLDLQKGVSLGQLVSGYSAVILATGAGLSRSDPLRNEGEVRDRILNSAEIFRFYNGKSSQASSKLEALSGCRKVAIIGNGNVTIDIARLFTRELASVQNNQRVNPAFTRFLERNEFESIQIVGRRGAVQAACAVKELRDLISDSKFNLHAFSEELDSSLTPGSLADCDDSIELSRRQNKKKLKIFQTMTQTNRMPASHELWFRFLLEPKAVEVRGGRRFLRCARVRLIDHPNGASIEQVSGVFEEIEFDILIKNLGFQLDNPEVITESPEILVPTFRTGWASSKGKGTIANLISDAQIKVQRMLDEAMNGKFREFESTNWVQKLLESAPENPEISKFFADGNSPSCILDKSGYLAFRELEKRRGIEISDPEAIKPFLKVIGKSK